MSSSEYIVATALKPRKKIIGERIEELIQRRSRIESYGNDVFTLMFLQLIYRENPKIGNYPSSACPYVQQYTLAG